MTTVEAIVAALADLSEQERSEVLRVFVVDVESLLTMLEHEAIVAAVERERLVPVSPYAGFRL